MLRSDDIPLRIAEIGLFGYLWHELYFGSKGQVPYMPFNDAMWRADRHRDDDRLSRGLLSVGLRLMMARAVDFSYEQHGLPSFEDLRVALANWQQFIDGRKEPTADDVRVIFGHFTAHHPCP